MRLLLLVVNLVMGASLLCVTADNHAAPHPKKNKLQRASIHKATVRPKGKKQHSAFALLRPKPVHRPSDVWDRIRLGMQMYSLTDKFIFQAKGEIKLDNPLPDINTLLLTSAVQVRLYRFQRYNLAALKMVLKHPKLPVTESSEVIYTAQSKPKLMPVASTDIVKPTSFDQVSDSHCAEVKPKVTPAIMFVQKPLQTGFLQASFVQTSFYAPMDMPNLALNHDEPIFQMPTRRCVASIRRTKVVSNPKPTKLPVNYSLKVPNPQLRASVNARVEKQIAWFAKRPEYLQLVSERARPYLYHIVEELSRHKLPMELALLPIVESAYKPTALSPMSAAGLWQFIPSTGRDFNLKQNGEYDERLDVTASTQAAIHFLSRLNRHFKGDWLLSLAAYNCGQGNVDGAIRRNLAKGLPTDYWSLSLPEETQNYVPRLLALAKIFANPDQYQLHVKPVKNEPYFIKVSIDDQIAMSQLANQDLRTVAAMANINFEQFSRLNPGYLNKTLGGQGPFRFILPIVNANHLQQNLYRIASFSPEQPVSTPLLSVKFNPQTNPSTAVIVEDLIHSKPG